MENKIFNAIECTGKLKGSDLHVMIYEENDKLNFIYLNFYSSKNLQILTNCEEKTIKEQMYFLIKSANIKMYFNDKNIEIYKKYLHKYVLEFAKKYHDEVDDFAISSELPKNILEEIEKIIMEE